MYKVLWKASGLATGAAITLVSFKKSLNLYRGTVLAESQEHSHEKDDATSNLPSNLDLELKQVQVFFRHGARTPLHVLEGYKQVPYNVDLVMRPHTLTLFPLERILVSTGMPCDWSGYENKLRHKNLLSGESIPGHLTGLGQEQMFGLGLRIREAYQKPLGLSTFDPSVFYVLSTNITRTVESARCVIAGIYGQDQLNAYASQHGPIKILVSQGLLNFLVPNTESCDVLRKVNHASMFHFDFVTSVKMDREEIEACIDTVHDVQLERLSKLQDQVNKVLESRAASGGNVKGENANKIGFNAYRQPYTDSEELRKVFQARNLEIDNVEHFWHNAISHHPVLVKHLQKDDMRALLHLRRVEVDEFQMKFKSGYRFIFHFDPNPYFHNQVISKEVCKLSDGRFVSSQITDIQWKKGKDLATIHRSSSDSDSNADTLSLFSWLCERGLGDSDCVGESLRELWKNPMEFYQHVSYKMDHSTTKKINFIFFYDDMTSRLAHGWWYPKGLEQFRKMTEENGARMMFYAMTGRHKRERPVVTSLSTGRLLKDMVDRAETFMTGQNPQRLCLYSSHDSTLVALLESLGLWRGVWPPFGSDVRLEIYQDRKSSQFYVKLLYQGQPEKLRGQNDSLIRWEEFKRIVEPYLVDQKEFEEICASQILEEIAKDVLEHEEGEVPEGKKSKKISETPAGM